MPDTRKNRLLLVSANRVTNPYPVFPLGVAFLEAALLKAGFAVRIWDELIDNFESLADGLSWASYVGISLRNADNVSASSPRSYINDYKKLLAEIRRLSDKPIIAGGSAFSIFPEELMEELQLDWGLIGEAEASIVQWISAMNGNRPLNQVSGLLYRNDRGVIERVPAVTLLPEAIPSPRPSMQWIQAYIQSGGMLNAQTQRGCALHCTYCTYPWIEGRCYRHRSPRNLVAELRHLQQAGVRYVFLTDSVFNTTRNHVEAFCKAIIKADLRIDWGCFARPRNLSADLLDLMIEAGLKHLEFGSDSFCDVTLKSYGKSFRFSDILEASEVAASRKVHTCHYIIFGGPGETEETIRETVSNSKRLPDAPVFAFSGMRIYPHTPLQKEAGSKQSAKELLEPDYFHLEALPDDRREQIIAECTRGLANWFLNDHADDNNKLTRQLRERGKQGPLWEYLPVSRRLASRSAVQP